jgi:ankyrin repeat protein
MPYCSDLIQRYRQAVKEKQQKAFFTKLNNNIIAVKDGEKSLLHYVIEDCCAEPERRCVFAARLLIKAGENVNSVYDDHTPLDFALEHGKLQIIKLLVDKGADVNRNSETLIPLLHVAVSSAIRKEHKKEFHLDAIEQLLQAGARIDAKMSDSDDYEIKDTPLHVALKEGGDVDIINLLLAYGADANAKYENGSFGTSGQIFFGTRGEMYKRSKFDVPLALAIRNTKLSSKDRLHAVKSLLEAGAHINQRAGVTDNALYRPLLHVALTECFDIDIIELLIAKKVDINSNYDRETPLTRAIKNLLNIVEKSKNFNSLEELNAIRIIQLLIVNGADMKKKMYWHQELYGVKIVSCAEYVVEISKKARRKHDYELCDRVGGAYVKLIRSFVRYGAVVSQAMRNPSVLGDFTILFAICSSDPRHSTVDLPELHVNEMMIWVDRRFNLGYESSVRGNFLNFDRKDRHKIIRRMVSPAVLEKIKDRANFSLVSKPLNRIIKGKFSGDCAHNDGENLSLKNKKQKSSSSEMQTRSRAFDDLTRCEDLLVMITNFIYQPGSMPDAGRRYNVMRKLLEWDFSYYCSEQESVDSISIQDCFPSAPVVINRGVPSLSSK